MIIDRDAASSRHALERWYGEPLPRFDAVVASVEQFKRAATSALVVPYADLEQYATVARIVGYCTGLALPLETWRTLDLLKIEQHRLKAGALHAIAA